MLLGLLLSIVGLGGILLSLVLEPRLTLDVLLPTGVLLLLAGQWRLWIRRFLPWVDSRRVVSGLSFLAASLMLSGWSLDLVFSHADVLADPSLVFSEFAFWAAAAAFAFALAFAVTGAQRVHSGLRGGANPRAVLVSAAEKLGLGPIRRRYLRRPIAEGVTDDFPVHLRGVDGSIEIQVGAPGIPFSLIVELEGRHGGARGLFPEQLKTGDKNFDGVAFLRGDPSEALAVLHGQARATLVRVLELGGTVGGQVLQIPAGTGGQTAETVEAATRLLLKAARQLVLIGPVPGLLRRNSREENDPSVRARNLGRALSAFPDEPATRDALRDAKADPSPIVRVLAAAHSSDPSSLPAAGQIEPSILVNLEAGHEPDVLLPLVVLLGEHGGATSYAKLQHFSAPPLRERVNVAMSRIRERLGNDGSLSISESESTDGAVSLLREKGAVSIAGGSKPRR